MDKYVGKRLDGRYEMRELIGVGGMAYVYKAFDCVDNRTVAVKILRDEFLTNEEFTRRFRNESKAIAILNHPNIVKVLDVGFGQHLQYIVMEYIDGITLKEYLDQRKDIRWKEAVHFAVQILRALQHAHDKGIVHRDIKPQNIMLLSDGTIKVTDFGIARLSRSEMRVTMDSKKAIGTVHYISPEQARGEITDEKTDLYAVGVVLYEMLTGRLPFEADNAVSVAIMQMQSEPTMPRLINEDIPEGLEQITIKAMQKNADKRYQSAAEMLSDFDEFKRNPSIKFAYTYFVDETPTRYADAITRVRGDEDIGKKHASDTQKKRKVSTVAILCAVAAAIVLVVGIGVILFLNMSNDKTEDITVDDFTNKSYSEYVLKHENIGNYQILEANIIREYNDSVEEGYVIRQEPLPGRSVKKGTQIKLYISKGHGPRAVPDVVERENIADVESKITAAGFIVNRVYEQHDKIEKDTIIRLEPKSGEMLPYGSTVTMVVSNGPEEVEKISMPDVLGSTSQDALQVLVSKGFDQRKITVKVVNHASNMSAGTVISTTPKADTMVDPSAEIELLVASGYKDVSFTIDFEKLKDGSKPVDIQVWVANGNLDSSLTTTNILPSQKKTLKITTKHVPESDDEAEYSVIVQIRYAGEGKYENLVSFTANAKTGGVSAVVYSDTWCQSETLPTSPGEE